MIHFFRRIRRKLFVENRISKYLVYAVGEIILVVIGILIALQINNWNEERKSALAENNRLVKLVEGLRTDSSSFSVFYQEIDQIHQVHEQLYAIGMKGTSPDSLGDFHTIRYLLRYHPVTRENDPLIVNKISDATIRQELLDYFRMEDDMTQVYVEFRRVVRDRMRIYLGEHGLYELKARFEASSENTDWINRDGLIAVSKEEGFQQILFEANLKLEGLRRELDTVTSQNERLKKVILDYLSEQSDVTEL